MTHSYFRVYSLWFAWVFLSGLTQAGDDVRPWGPVAPGMVLTRNVMVPESPAKDGFQLLPGKYRLGSKAYAKAPPDWWLRMIGDTGVGDKWHPKDFPLVYAGEFKSKDGKVALLVVQASQAFTGDGSYSPGPVIYLVARMFSLDGGLFKLLKEEAYVIGSMQFSRLLAGAGSGRHVVFPTESGSGFNARVIKSKTDWTFSVADDNTFSIKKGETVTLKE